MSSTSIGGSRGKRLAPDLGALLAADMRTWPPELANDEAVGWIREYRDRGAEWRRRNATLGQDDLDDSSRYVVLPGDGLAGHAARSALLWRVDLCIKLLLHIGWQWTTAVQLLNDTAEALTPHKMRVAAALARQQFQQRQDERASSSGASALMPSAVLRASDEQLEAALRSIYSESRDLHAGRLKQAQAWWPDWLNEVSLLQWQADLVDGHPRSRSPLVGSDDGGLYLTLITLDRLCQPPALLATMVRDGASREELLAPDPGMWSSADAAPISEFFASLFNNLYKRRQRDAIAYWLQHSRLPEEVKSVAAPLTATTAASAARVMSAAELAARARSAAELNLAAELAARARSAAELNLAEPAARQIDPDDFIDFTISGRYLEASGQFEEALAAYDRAIVHLRDNFTAWLHKAEILMRLGRLEEALATLDQAPRSTPHEEAQIWRHRGTIFDQLSRHVDARAAFERARVLEISAEAAEVEGAADADEGVVEITAAEYAYAEAAAVEAAEVEAEAEAAAVEEAAAETTSTAEAADEADQAAEVEADAGYEP